MLPKSKNSCKADNDCDLSPGTFDMLFYPVVCLHFYYAVALVDLASKQLSHFFSATHMQVVSAQEIRLYYDDYVRKYLRL